MKTCFDQHRRTIFYPKTDVEGYAELCKALALSRDSDLARHLSVARELCLRHWGRAPECIEPILAGTFHLLYRAELEPGRECVIRLNRLPALRRAWEFEREAWVYANLAAHGLPAPTVIVTDCSRTVCPVEYQIMTHVPGRPLTEFQDSETQAMAPALLQAVGECVARVHTIRLTGYGPLSIANPVRPAVPGEARQSEAWVGLHPRWSDYILLRLDEHIAVCQAIGAITSAEAATIAAVFERQRDLLEGISPVLLHGDLGSHNMLSADGTTVAALIDWEDCMSGDPVFDIAFWGTFVREHMCADFLTGYRWVATLPDDFEVRYWLYYLRIALSKTVHRHRFGYTDCPGRPPASQRIQRALFQLICELGN